MRALRIWLTATLVVCLWSGAGTAGAADLRVERARADLRAARAAAEEVATDLDRAAAAYEQARSHAERLAAEALDTRRTTVEARDAAVRADDVVQQRLMMLFKHPELATQAWAPGALSGSVGETLHRVELIEQLTQLGARDRGRAERALGRVRDAEH
ncbi:MAG TPA: hypothetical protein VK891_01060, partial [Euzebyales bacterium]|nr:hypothetical protein [Euzebyales bacterium]